jgi:hypothetical protein
MSNEYFITPYSERKTDTQLLKLAREFIMSVSQKEGCNCCDGNYCDYGNDGFLLVYVGLS